MRVELSLVFLLETKNDLAGNNAFLCAFELEVRIKRYLCGIFINMSLHSPVVDVILRNAVLVNAHCGQGIQRAWVNLLTAVGYDAYHNFLPASLAPGPRPRPRTKM